MAADESARNADYYGENFLSVASNNSLPGLSLSALFQILRASSR
jgi:hypothetical protein